MDIWVLCYFLYDNRRDTVVLSKGVDGGGGGCPPCNKSMRGSLGILKLMPFSIRYYKSLSINEVSHNNKIIVS